ncbi:MAG TPA: alpha/beta fold hydrolase [Thermoanaerobaculia bacterium]|jgi:surfactin synthase thioesterase subunit
MTTTTAAANRWIAYRKPRPHARLRLFCFPYAGGGASIYRTWQAALPPEVEVCPVQPPGRENRLSEERFLRVGPFAAAICDALAPLLDLPFALFGHSLGAVVGYETALKLRDEAGKSPLCLLVSARRAPRVPPDDEPTYDLPDAEFRAKLQELEGTPEEVLVHPELMQLVEPLLRADFELNDTYEPSDRPPLACPVTAFGGLEDPDVAREQLEPWREVTRGPFRLRMFAGGHFFLQEQQQALLAAVAQELMPRLAAT